MRTERPDGVQVSAIFSEPGERDCRATAFIKTGADALAVAEQILIAQVRLVRRFRRDQTRIVE